MNPSQPAEPNKPRDKKAETHAKHEELTRNDPPDKAAVEAAGIPLVASTKTTPEQAAAQGTAGDK